VHIVARRLGHRDPSVTLNTYADAVPNDNNRAAETFARAV
jgi:integrase